MSAEHPHRTLTLSLWAAIADGDPEAIAMLLADDVIWMSMGLNPHSGEYRGPAEVLDYLAGVGEAADELASRVESVYVSDEGAILLYHSSVRRGDRVLEMDYYQHLSIRDGLVVRGLLSPADQRKNDDFWL